MNVLTLTVLPNHTIHFPGLCAHCAQPARQTYPIQKQIAQIQRLVEVPFCSNCFASLNRKSLAQERRQSWGRIVSIVLGVVVFALVLLLSPVTLHFVVRLLFALLVGGGVATAVYMLFHHYSQKASLPEKQNILESAQIEHFDSLTITFLFSNPTFAERFTKLNKSLQMES